MAARTGYPGQDRHTGQSGHECMDRTVKTGELRGKNAETGNWERTGQLEMKSQDRTTVERKPG